MAFCSRSRLLFGSKQCTSTVLRTRIVAPSEDVVQVQSSYGPIKLSLGGPRSGTPSAAAPLGRGQALNVDFSDCTLAPCTSASSMPRAKSWRTSTCRPDPSLLSKSLPPAATMSCYIANQRLPTTCELNRVQLRLKDLNS